MGEVSYNPGLHLVVYELRGHPEETEVVIGINGTTDRLQRDGWTEKSRYLLREDTDYMKDFFGDGSRIKPLIQRPPHQGDQLFVGSPQRGIQFTVPLSNVEAFVEIVKEMCSKK